MWCATVLMCALPSPHSLHLRAVIDAEPAATDTTPHSLRRHMIPPNTSQVMSQVLTGQGGEKWGEMAWQEERGNAGW